MLADGAVARRQEAGGWVEGGDVVLKKEDGRRLDKKFRHVSFPGIEEMESLEVMWWRLPRWCSGRESARQCRRCRREGFNPYI